MAVHPSFGQVADDSIIAAFICSEDCPICKGTGHVCEAHPGLPWDLGDLPDDMVCHCGAPGMPCPTIDGIAG